MLFSGLALFFFGTAVSAGSLIPHVKAPTEIVVSKHLSADKVTEYYPSSSGSPFISNFIQKGTNVFFKPQFMLSAAQMPPQIQTMIAAIEKDDCKTTLPMGPIPMFLEEPLQVLQQEVVASSKPIVNEVIEINPVEYNQHVKPTIELTPLVQLPKLPMLIDKKPLTLAVENQFIEAVAIPAAPVLPPFKMPELPVVIKESSIVPCPPNEVHISQLEVIGSPLNQIIIEEKPMVVPEAPVLPPLSLPELPIVVEVEDKVVPCDIVEEVEHLVIPEAPVLTPYVPIKPPISVLAEEHVTVEIQRPVAIPSAPVLPPLEMHKTPVIVEEFVAPCSPENELEHSKILIESRPIAMPIPYAFPEISISDTRIPKPTIMTYAPQFLARMSQ